MEQETPIKIDIVKIQMVRDATIEYGRRAIRCPKELAELGLQFLKNADREMMLLVTLSIKNHINCIHLVSVGTVSSTLVSPREVMKTAILSNASAIAFVHNHPSGLVEPSQEDIQITKRMAECADLFDIRLLDHVIVSDEGQYESLTEMGILNPSYTPTPIQVKEANPSTCRDCGNKYEVNWVEEGEDFNDFGTRYCPFCGAITREW